MQSIDYYLAWLCGNGVLTYLLLMKIQPINDIDQIRINTTYHYSVFSSNGQYQKRSNPYQLYSIDNEAWLISIGVLSDSVIHCLRYVTNTFIVNILCGIYSNIENMAVLAVTAVSVIFWRDSVFSNIAIVSIGVMAYVAMW